VLLVFGNPAIHSVKNAMFFFSRSDGGRHAIWGKLDGACLVRAVHKKTRYQEAITRQKLILSGSASRRYSVGLTTFYSFPTVKPAGARSLTVITLYFAPLLFLMEIEKKEKNQICSCLEIRCAKKSWTIPRTEP